MKGKKGIQNTRISGAGGIRPGVWSDQGNSKPARIFLNANSKQFTLIWSGIESNKYLKVFQT